MGLMGEYGEAVQRIWSEQGVIAPTPTATMPATATAPTTPTVTPTVRR
jgi:hypothetical protein